MHHSGKFHLRAEQETVGNLTASAGSLRYGARSRVQLKRNACTWPVSHNTARMRKGIPRTGFGEDDAPYLSLLCPTGQEKRRLKAYVEILLTLMIGLPYLVVE